MPSRSARLVAVSISLVAVMATGLPPAAAAAPEGINDAASMDARQKVRVSLKTTTKWVRKGGTAVLKGKVSGVRGRKTVTIMQRNKNRPRWTVEARKSTTRKGSFRHREDVKSGSRYYKACLRGRCSASVLVNMGKRPPKPPTAPAATSVSIVSIAPGLLEAGAPFQMTGGASGNLEGQTVSIQSYDAGTSSWGSVGSGVVANGTWVASVSVLTAGTAIPLRASFQGAVGLSASASGSAAATIYGWYYISDQNGPDYVSSSYDHGYGPYSVNGLSYPKSLGLEGSSDTAYYEANLARACVRLAATVGLDDGSDTTTRTTARVITDSVTKWSKAGIALGQSHAMVLDVTGALRLRLETVETVRGYDDLVFGDLRALCAY